MKRQVWRNETSLMSPLSEASAGSIIRNSELAVKILNEIGHPKRRKNKIYFEIERQLAPEPNESGCDAWLGKREWHAL
jgi:hypothetical protein